MSTKIPGISCIYLRKDGQLQWAVFRSCDGLVKVDWRDNKATGSREWKAVGGLQGKLQVVFLIERVERAWEILRAPRTREELP